jgi:hypothetical protein
VHVVERHDDGSLERHLLEQAPRRREGLVAGERERSVVTTRSTEDVADGGERHVLAVRRAATDENDRLGRVVEELLDEPRLPDPGIAEHGHETQARSCDDVGVRGAEPLELAGSAGERGVLAARDRCRFGTHGVESERTRRSGLAVQLQRLELGCRNRVRDERLRRLAQQDLTRLGGLLEARGDVDRVARGKALGGPGDDLAGADAEAGANAERRQRVAHLERCTTGPKRVVLVQHGHPEHRHHCIADELLDRPSVRLDDRLHAVEVPREQRAQGLGIRRLAHCRRARHIAEQDGHDLPLLPRRRGRLRERRRAVAAEAEPVRVLVAAAATRRHPASLGRSIQPGQRRCPLSLPIMRFG